ncbi:unnamed protein product [Soboliphyme baturini]|uniref:Uncharacterized protein n=1 Tax=Soboliphyme baturini TaxID=241478 RepID=A0A183JBE5_9BILA|nr:unnamed protein product [Soboliphyme baturini]
MEPDLAGMLSAEIKADVLKDEISKMKNGGSMQLDSECVGAAQIERNFEFNVWYDCRSASAIRQQE